MIHIQNLNLANNNKITDEGIKNMIQMRKLNLWSNNKISNEGIKNMTQIQELDIHHNKIIIDEEIKIMIHNNFLFNCYAKNLSSKFACQLYNKRRMNKNMHVKKKQ
jgi:Leucine-rich repeat (LRR) protein